MFCLTFRRFKMAEEKISRFWFIWPLMETVALTTGAMGETVATEKIIYNRA